jgi:chemotaxis family two-component system response regulator Rcp1
MTTLGSLKSEQNTRRFEILLVEDNVGDIRLVEEAFNETGLPHRLHAVGNGVQAMAFLRREGRKYADAPRPDLILLDLNMKQKDGRETLAEIKADRHLRSIPVVILTGSAHERDIFRAYDLQANSYVVKPMDIDEFIEAIKSIENYWFYTARNFLR